MAQQGWAGFCVLFACCHAIWKNLMRPEQIAVLRKKSPTNRRMSGCRIVRCSRQRRADGSVEVYCCLTPSAPVSLYARSRRQAVALARLNRALRRSRGQCPLSGFQPGQRPHPKRNRRCVRASILRYSEFEDEAPQFRRPRIHDGLLYYLRSISLIISMLSASLPHRHDMTPLRSPVRQLTDGYALSIPERHLKATSRLIPACLTTPVSA